MFRLEVTLAAIGAAALLPWAAQSRWVLEWMILADSHEHPCQFPLTPSASLTPHPFRDLSHLSRLPLKYITLPQLSHITLPHPPPAGVHPLGSDVGILRAI